MAEWRVTFGQKYPREQHPTFPAANRDGWLTVIADTEEDARRATIELLGRQWSSLYAVWEFDHDNNSPWYPLGELGRISADTMDVNIDDVRRLDQLVFIDSHDWSAAPDLEPLPVGACGEAGGCPAYCLVDVDPADFKPVE